MPALVTIQSDLDRLQAQLGDLATSIRLAQKAGQTAALEMFRSQYREIARKLAVLRAAASEAEAPSEFMQRLDAFSDDVIAEARAAGADVRDIVHATTGLVKWMPVVLLVALVVVGVGFWRRSLKVSR